MLLMLEIGEGRWRFKVSQLCCCTRESMPDLSSSDQRQAPVVAAARCPWSACFCCG
jgi:hypothetical protein